MTITVLKYDADGKAVEQPHKFDSSFITEDDFPGHKVVSITVNSREVVVYISEQK